MTKARPLRSRMRRTPRVLLAILTKQKEASLPLYLECIEALDYPKASVCLSIRTNSKTDGTERILREWITRVEHLYANIEFDASDIALPVQQFAVHEWNAVRFRVLGHIRGVSLRKTCEHGCNYYFTFPEWSRSFAFAGRYASANGFTKMIHVEFEQFPDQPPAAGILQQSQRGLDRTVVPSARHARERDSGDSRVGGAKVRRARADASP